MKEKTYGLILPVLEHALGEVLVVPRVGDLAVVALMLDLRAADAERAANKAFRLGVEGSIVLLGCDDLLLQVGETVGGVLILLLLNLAAVAGDARDCQLALWADEGLCGVREWERNAVEPPELFARGHSGWLLVCC